MGTATAGEKKFGLAIHGGAGTITRANLSGEKEAAIRSDLGEALDAGYRILHDGGSSLDAVQAAITVLEDSPRFNAGHGAVYTNTETHELDASLMDGNSLSAGAVAAASTVRNPILLARKIMDESVHVMLSGAGADEFAGQMGLELVDNDYFNTEFRFNQLKAAQARSDASSMADPLQFESKFGTVGAVALDRHGNLAAGTSTGGTTNKRFGRIGDSPIIGAGTYADNRSCAVSATGHGEYFIRHAVAHEICARTRLAGESLEAAADHVVRKELVEAGGSGGVIAIDRQGHVTMPFNTEGMYRGLRMSDGRMSIAIYKD
ncbi:MAG: isoaspartyl peptidase/L-asparaginase [Gammaproteobacteria bacterium]|nr:isoaspartyl peptidase/L-asparaginase [Gammaproteobacteria bacterium]